MLSDIIMIIAAAFFCYFFYVAGRAKGFSDCWTQYVKHEVPENSSSDPGSTDDNTDSDTGQENQSANGGKGQVQD